MPYAVYGMPNLLLNGDFESDLDNWSTTGTTFTSSFIDPFYSPSGDGSHFACIVSDSRTYSSTLYQTVDMTNDKKFRLSLDFTLATMEPGFGDDFRAELWIDYLGGGPYTPIFSYYSGDGIFQSYDPVNYPGLRHYTRRGFTYDFDWADPSEDMVLRFLVMGYDSDYVSAMLLDNVKVEAIPEPATVSLFIIGIGMAGVGLIRRKKSR